MSISPPKILLIGASGQVGSHICATAKAEGLPLLAPSHDSLDITNQDSLKRYLDAEKPDAIINASAYTDVEGAEDNQDAAFQLNYKAVENLAKATPRASLILHLSTDYVFDGTGSSPLTEAAPTVPLNVYGRSKLAGEQALLDKHARSIILRTSWVFSATHACFVRTMLDLSIHRDELSIVSDQMGSPTHAQSIADILLNLANKYATLSRNDYGLYHFTDTPAVSWYEFAQAIFREKENLGHTAPTLIPVSSDAFQTKAQRPHYSVLDCSKICDTFNIKQNNWRDTLTITVKEILRVRENS